MGSLYTALTNIGAAIKPDDPDSSFLFLKLFTASDGTLPVSYTHLDVYKRQGRGTGKVHFYGKFKGLNLDGAVMTDASMKFDILNTHFAVRDTIHLAPTGLKFNNMHIADMEGHSGTLNGYLRFQHFKNINYRFEIQANNMLLMNTKESTDMPFFGTVYALSLIHI